MSSREGECSVKSCNTVVAWGMKRETQSIEQIFQGQFPADLSLHKNGKEKQRKAERERAVEGISSFRMRTSVNKKLNL